MPARISLSTFLITLVFATGIAKADPLNYFPGCHKDMGVDQRKKDLVTKIEAQADSADKDFVEVYEARVKFANLCKEWSIDPKNPEKHNKAQSAFNTYDSAYSKFLHSNYLMTKTAQEEPINNSFHSVEDARRELHAHPSCTEELKGVRARYYGHNHQFYALPDLREIPVCNKMITSENRVFPKLEIAGSAPSAQAGADVVKQPDDSGF